MREKSGGKEGVGGIGRERGGGKGGREIEKVRKLGRERVM